MTYLQLAMAGAIANLLLGLGRMSPLNLAIAALLFAGIAWTYANEGAFDAAAQARQRARERRKGVR